MARPAVLCHPLPSDPLKMKYGTVSFVLRHELILKAYSVSTLPLVAMVTVCGSDRLFSGVKPSIQEPSAASAKDYG